MSQVVGAERLARQIAGLVVDGLGPAAGSLAIPGDVADTLARWPGFVQCWHVGPGGPDQVVMRSETVAGGALSLRLEHNGIPVWHGILRRAPE